MELETFKLEEYLATHGPSASYLLSSSDCESWTMQEIINMANESERQVWNNLRLGYTKTKGLPSLRNTLAASLYPGLDLNQILCFAGAQEGIFCSLFALCQPQDHVIVLTPCYQSLLQIPKLKGCDVTCIALREENEWRIDCNEIKKSITENTKFLIINFPHNPTGQIITPNELKDLIALLDHYGIWLFSDEVYRLLGPANTDWPEPAACLYPKALSLGVMSKAYGMAGLRIGWIACQNTMTLQKIERVKDYTANCNSAPSEILSLIALRNQEIILSRNNSLIDGNLELLDDFLSKLQSRFSWVRPEGGCLGFVKDRSQESTDSFCQRLLEKTGVLLIPSSVYGLPARHFRIGFGRQTMPEALKRLYEFIQYN